MMGYYEMERRSGKIKVALLLKIYGPRSPTSTQYVMLILYILNIILSYTLNIIYIVNAHWL